MPASLTSSTEPKAVVQTAELIARCLGLELSTRDGLREHRRPGEFLSRADFHSNIRTFFENPTRVVYGQESCDDLGMRIENEVVLALSHGHLRNAILATHGMAMTSYIMRHWKVDPLEVWESLGLPAYLAFTVPTFDIVASGNVDESLFRMTQTGA